MKKMKLLSIVSLAVLAGSMIMQSTYAANTTVTFVINNGTVTYGGPASLTFSSALNVSFVAQSINQDFTGSSNYFWVQDLKGSDSGYNTTLQLSGSLTTGSNSITGANVSFKALASIIVVSGSTNPGVQYDSNTSSYQALNASRTFIYRPNAANTGNVGYYAGTINIKVDVPAGQPAGAYAGTLVYTLIEN